MQVEIAVEDAIDDLAIGIDRALELVGGTENAQGGCRRQEFGIGCRFEELCLIVFVHDIAGFEIENLNANGRVLDDFFV